METIFCLQIHIIIIIITSDTCVSLWNGAPLHVLKTRLVKSSVQVLTIFFLIFVFF